MILDVLVFTLGFLLAGLLALSALPAVWRRALRLSEGRLSRLLPLSAEEIAAERDHLRAAHAVELRRTEQRAERAGAAEAALRGEVARREARIDALRAELAAVEGRLGDLAAAHAALRHEADGLWAEHGAESVALDGLSRLAETRLADLAALGAERDGLLRQRDGLLEEVDRGRGRAAALETRLAGAEMRAGDLGRALAESRAAPPSAPPPPPEAAAATAAPPEAAPSHAAPPEAASRPADTAALLSDQAREIERLRLELAFLGEQAASAERRAAEARAEAAMLGGRRGAGGGRP